MRNVFVRVFQHGGEDVTYIRSIVVDFVLFFRLKQSKMDLYKASFCSGGDNNPGLIVWTAQENDKQFAINDTIVGRPSQGFIAKVFNLLLCWLIIKKIHSTGVFFVSICTLFDKLDYFLVKSKRTFLFLG